MKISTITCILTLLVGVSVITTSDAFGQYDDVSSPKKQIESGVEPSEVVCRDGLVLATRSNGNVACLKDSIAKKLTWKIIETNFSDSDKTEKNAPNPRDEENMLNENDKSEEQQIPWREDLAIGMPKRLAYFVDPRDGIIPEGSLKPVIQISGNDSDTVADKIAEILGDKIIRNNGIRYDTDQGVIHFSYAGKNIDGFSYTGRTDGIISYEKGKQIVEKLTDLLGITFDGTEFVNNHLNPHGEYYFTYVQQKDDLRITNNRVWLNLGPEITQIRVGNWFENLSELEFYDPSKLPEISMPYAKQFEVLAEPPCSISDRGIGKPLSLKFMSGTFVYESYAGSCHLNNSFFNPDFYTYIDAITGEPYFIEKDMSY